MNAVDVKIKVLKEGHLPDYHNVTDSGADCFASLDEPVILKAKSFIKIPLGFALELPLDYEIQVRPRSGLAAKNGIVCNFGTIDNDYRGELCAILFNFSDIDFDITEGDKICQAVLAPVYHASFIMVDKLSETKRGENGFGSSGFRTSK